MQHLRQLLRQDDVVVHVVDGVRALAVARVLPVDVEAPGNKVYNEELDLKIAKFNRSLRS